MPKDKIEKDISDFMSSLPGGDVTNYPPSTPVMAEEKTELPGISKSDLAGPPEPAVSINTLTGEQKKSIAAQAKADVEGLVGKKTLGAKYYTNLANALAKSAGILEPFPDEATFDMTKIAAYNLQSLLDFMNDLSKEHVWSPEQITLVKCDDGYQLSSKPPCPDLPPEPKPDLDFSYLKPILKEQIKKVLQQPGFKQVLTEAAMEAIKEVFMPPQMVYKE